MSDLIYIKIDVTKILEAKLFAGKNGAKYLDAVLIPSRNSQYGDSHMIVQSLTKEERQAGQKGPIIGNAKTPEGDRRNGPATESTRSTPPSQAQRTASAPVDEDVPF